MAKVMPVFSGLYGNFLSAFCHTVMYSGCCNWWSVLRISISPLKLSTLRPSKAAATFTGSVDLALAMAAPRVWKMRIVDAV